MKNERSLYSVHPTVSYVATMLVNLQGRTGRTLEEWSGLVLSEAPPDSKTWRIWLKENHGIGGNTAMLIRNAIEGQHPENYDADRYLDVAVDYVREMYGGKKGALQPMYDNLLERVFETGDEIKLSPTKTAVPVYRNHVIAQIKPTTQSRIDLGLALKGYAETLPERLISTGGLEKGDRITHRIAIQTSDDIDDEVSRWLRIAYELDGK